MPWSRELYQSGHHRRLWARVRMVRNWGTPMTRKVEPELVTGGPYRLVRHPIYSGILLGGLGTAVALNWLRLIVTGLAGINFLYSARVDERDMTGLFPGTYPAYRALTKMFVPFVL